MCISCGCGNYQDAHGDQRNLTVASFQNAAAAAGITVDEVIKNMQQGAAALAGSNQAEVPGAGQAVKDRLS